MLISCGRRSNTACSTPGKMPGTVRAVDPSLRGPLGVTVCAAHCSAAQPGKQPGDIMCTLHRARSISFLEPAELIDGLEALISRANSPELREYHEVDLTGGELPWKDMGITLGKGQEVTFLLGGRVWLA